MTDVAPAAAATAFFPVRPAVEGDTAFLFDSFLRAYRESDYTRGLTNTQFLGIYKAQWSAVLDTFSVLVAHARDDADEIAGYVAHRDRCVAFVYVKKTPWRKLGVSRVLMSAAGLEPGAPIYALFPTRVGLAWANALGYSVRITPHVEALRILGGGE